SSLQSSSSSLYDQSGEIIKDFPENPLGQIDSNSFIDNAQHDMPLLIAASSINDLVSPVK
uniref:Uncharacterized protein n=1 Tax=Romanomermis culicivorax TaxID=13658 RepID=A0A915HHL8_ROMCU